MLIVGGKILVDVAGVGHLAGRHGCFIQHHGAPSPIDTRIEQRLDTVGGTDLSRAIGADPVRGPG